MIITKRCFHNVLFAVLLISAIRGYSQIQPGSWREHFSYNFGIALTQSPEKVYCATPSGVFSYTHSSGKIEKLSRVNGLTGIDISTICFSTNKNVLAIGYENGNIDLIFNDRIKTIPDIKNKIMQGSKRINHFYFDNNTLFASTDFGIVAIDIDKIEIKDTYFIGSNGDPVKCNAVAIFQNRIYAATQRGLLSAEKNDPLLIHYLRWMQESGFADPQHECVDLAVFQDKVIAVEGNTSSQKDIIWAFDQYGWTEVGQYFNSILHVRSAFNKLTISSTEGIAIFTSLGLLPAIFNSYGFSGNFEPQMAIPIDLQNIAVADRYFGMVYGTPGSFDQVCPNGPISNKVFSIGLNEERIVVAAGAYDATYSNRWYQFSFHTFQNETWRSFVDWSRHDAVRVVFNPANSDEYFIASWGHGVFRYQGDILKNQYNQNNSTLQTIYPNEPYCRISGMTFDDKGNLWVANSMVSNPISVRKKDTTWVSFPYSNQINSDWLSDIVYSPFGTLWLILPGGEGIFVLNPGNDISSTSDDRFRKIKPLDRNGNALPGNINAIAFDRDDYLWVATTQGVLISYNAEKVLENNTFFQKVKIPDIVPGLASYLLETESVTSIAVDGGNRKWFGTLKSGLFLQSGDGSEELHHFTSLNSPLPSDYILDIKVHPTTGEVFITTDKGLVSYRSIATLPADRFKKVYVYPNPVRPDFNGDIIITGLVENTNVKITDVSGNLVYETTSIGGQASWNGRNLNGNKIATGVYLVFCSDSKGEQTAVTKLLFVK